MQNELKRRLEKEYSDKCHELAVRLVSAGTVDECMKISDEYDKISDALLAKDPDLYRGFRIGNRRLSDSIGDKIEMLRHPEKHPAISLAIPPDIPAEKVDPVERERLRKEYLGKLADILRRLPTARTREEAMDLHMEFLAIEDYEKIDPELFRSLKKERDNAWQRITTRQRELLLEFQKSLEGKTNG